MAEPQHRNRAYDPILSFLIDADFHLVIVRFCVKTDLAIFEFLAEAEGEKSFKVDCDSGIGGDGHKTILSAIASPYLGVHSLSDDAGLL
jgi:hypothetical protein